MSLNESHRAKLGRNQTSGRVPLIGGVLRGWRGPALVTTLMTGSLSGDAGLGQGGKNSYAYIHTHESYHDRTAVHPSARAEIYLCPA